jgi:alcohol dehydrogenase class IV
MHEACYVSFSALRAVPFVAVAIGHKLAYGFGVVFHTPHGSMVS